VRWLTLTLLSVLALAIGAVASEQVRAQLTPPANAVGRNAALIQSVTRLESENRSLRDAVGRLQGQVVDLEASAPGGAGYRALLQSLGEARMQAGLVAVHGSGVTVTLDSGPDPNSSLDQSQRWLVQYQDVQDLVNLLWAAGAEAVSVNGQRVGPETAFFRAGPQVGISTGLPTSPPLTINALGNPDSLTGTLSDRQNLGDLRTRAAGYHMTFTWQRGTDIALPAYDGAYLFRYAVPLQ
jgi:uncharacterized protein YlxW (UPF0749 family)